MPMQPIGGPLQFDQSPLGAPLVAAPAAPKKKGGMFGSKLGIGEAIVAALNGYLAARGNPAGMAGLEMLNQRNRERADQEQYKQRREDHFQDWVKQQAYQAANPGPDELSVQMQAAGIDPASEQGRAMRIQALQNKINPFVAITQQNPDGSEMRQFIRPPMMGMGQPQIGAVMDDPRKQGGPMPQASGGFPGPF